MPARPFSRSRSHWSATAPDRSSRSSPPPPPWTWAWASTPPSTCPARFEAKGLGEGGAKGCPRETWCVENYRDPRNLTMSVTEALAKSPNTAFAKLISQVGVSARSTWPSDSACGPTPNRAPPAATTRTTTRAWPTSSSGRTSGRSPWAPSRSTRWNWPMSRRRWPPAGCGARPTRSTRSTTGAAMRSRSTPKPASRWCPRDWPTPCPTPWARTPSTAPRHRRPTPPAGPCRCRARPAPPRHTARRVSWATPTGTRR